MEDPLIYDTEAFWEQDDCALLLNPKVPCDEEFWLKHWLPTQPDLKGHVVFRTSGSEGHAKFVCLSKQALLNSARMVNAHLEATAEDVWLGSLPLFHVGGLGIAARAYAAGCVMVFSQSKWDPRAFCETCRLSGVSLTSLVPTQVYDLIRAECAAPPSLRAVLVGGGVLEALLDSQARSLGWPLLTTYGMTETASQIATQALGASQGDALFVLPKWETRPATNGCLMVRGESLFSGYLVQRKFVNPKSADGWFETSDNVLLGERHGLATLQFQRRHHALLKIKGELVSLEEIRRQLMQLAGEHGVNPAAITAIGLNDARDGQVLVWVSESSIALADSEALRARHNAAAPGHLRIKAHAHLSHLPRTPLGKLAESQLQNIVSNRLAETNED